jgi:hypothetical protein
VCLTVGACEDSRDGDAGALLSHDHVMVGTLAPHAEGVADKY